MKMMAWIVGVLMLIGVTASCLSPGEAALVAKWKPSLLCIQRHESGGDYRAQNPVSSASGAYQFVDGTWRSASRAAGKPGWSRAKYAPWWIQDYVAAFTLNVGGQSHWDGTHCFGR